MPVPGKATVRGSGTWRREAARSLGRTAAAALLTAPLFGAGFARAQAEAPAPENMQFWQVRGFATMTDDAREALAKASVPLWRKIETKGVTARALVNEVCGEQPPRTTEFLIAQTKRINRIGSIDDVVPVNAAVAVPFCLKVETDVPVIIKAGDTIESILKNNYGVFGPKTVGAVFKKNYRKFKSFSVKDFAQSLQIGSEIILPNVSEPQIFASQTSLTTVTQSESFDDIRPQIEATATPVAGAPDRQDFQFRTIESVSLESTSAQCRGPAVATAFVDPAKLRERFEAEEKLKRAVDGTGAQPVIVGIIDSGLAVPGDSFFADMFFARNPGEVGKPLGTDDDNNSHKDDIYGINYNQDNGQIVPYVTSGRNAPHGTKMASLLLGGPEIAESWLKQRLDPLIQLVVVNFASSTTIGENVDAVYLADAVQYLNDRGASIINMSLASGQSPLPFTNTIGNLHNVLFVVAAGNAVAGHGTSLDGQPLVYPALYGGHSGDRRSNVVTVGAVDRDGGLADFSNYSAQYVDLSAPGCGINTRDDKGLSQLDNGTSPATAIVTFTSALMRSLGVTGASAVKFRLLAAADVSGDLKKASWSSGRLNVITAISVRSDVVTTASGPKFGRLENAQSLARYCGDEETRRSLGPILKVVPNVVEAGETKVYFLVRLGSNVEKASCRQADLAADDSIGRIDGVAGPSLREVRDITLATF